MTHLEKVEIQGFLAEFVALYPSQAKAVTGLKNISEATIIAIKKGKWETISEAMWRSLGKQLGYISKKVESWKFVETTHTHELCSIYEDARLNSLVFGIVSSAGSGKTYPTEQYVAKTENVYHLNCAEYFNKKTFLSLLLKKMGKENTGYSTNEMVEAIVDLANKTENPLIILDEADKLSDQVLYFFITLYNLLADKCGIILMATPQFQKRIARGVRLDKRGYAEIYSRIGKKFIELEPNTVTDMLMICNGNGIEDKATVMQIINESEGDLRRVKRSVIREKMKVQSKAA